MKLSRSTWQTHCNSFNAKTGLQKVWRMQKGMAEKTNSRNTGRNLALHLNIEDNELAKLAAETFYL